MQAIITALLWYSHPAAIAYGRFFRRYSQMLTRLEFEIHHAHGRRLGPSLVTLHVQLAWQNLKTVQFYLGETVDIDHRNLDQASLCWRPRTT
jgi:hypothetical protein